MMKYDQDERKARLALDALKRLWLSDENASGIIESRDLFGWHETCPVHRSSSDHAAPRTPSAPTP